ncbi:MAG: hypothetical protein DCF16_15130 [Alphaproteobacteria bacterium]|nr:MAG: hypothetical protein DCF16_15130 [Alphaproteobacteria bacterium]
MKEVSGLRLPVAVTEVHRAPLEQRLLGAFTLALISPIAIGAAAAAFVLLPQNLAIALTLALIAMVIALLVGYVARDNYAKWVLRVEFGPNSAALRLPAGRSLIHRLPAFSGVIRYADIAAVETRLEAYRSVGLAAMQRAYGLRLSNGALIILGEDRAVGTNFEQLGTNRIATALAARAEIAVTDLGMVEGRGGVLMVVGAGPESWSAPSLGQSAQGRLWRRVASTGAAPMIIFLLALLLAAVFS